MRRRLRITGAMGTVPTLHPRDRRKGRIAGGALADRAIRELRKPITKKVSPEIRKRRALELMFRAREQAAKAMQQLEYRKSRDRVSEKSFALEHARIVEWIKSLNSYIDSLR